MPYTIKIPEEAQQDIQNAFDWYEEQLPVPGEKFLKELYPALDKIALNPEYYSFVFREFRDTVTKNISLFNSFQN